MTRLSVWNDFLSARDDLESRSSNLDPSERRAQSSEFECPCIHDPETQGGKEEGATTAYGSNYAAVEENFKTNLLRCY
ncbi:hypothetical protein MKW98_027326 [Papaver atlanticum]|uniref:Uncharacterized protein n=1 Tax=Papaver atlanticum TaxID=357466 RepID=A0AAD4SRF7_9MAGN|nr:hypothetical protein MKW98_027326 [Papaver atlanticum]